MGAGPGGTRYGLGGCSPAGAARRCGSVRRPAARRAASPGCAWARRAAPRPSRPGTGISAGLGPAAPTAATPAAAPPSPPRSPTLALRMRAPLPPARCPRPGPGWAGFPPLRRVTPGVELKRRLGSFVSPSQTGAASPEEERDRPAPVRGTGRALPPASPEQQPRPYPQPRL